MIDKLTVQVITVNGEEFKCDAHSISFYSTTGHVGILPGHITSVINISYTAVELIDENEQIINKFFVTSGLVSVRDNSISFLTKSFIQKSDLNVNELKKKLKFCNENYQKAKSYDDKAKLLHEKLVLEEKSKILS